jgi:hypothetical protein
MKIAVIGNCQRVSIVQAMQAMHRGLQIKDINVAGVIDGSINLENCLEDCEVIVSQKEWWATQFLDPIVARHAYRVLYCPRIYFEAFHPDLTYVQSGGAFVQSPMVDYNSKIVFFAYLRALSVDDTLRLFNADMYEALGYLNLWTASKEVLFTELRATDFPTDELFGEWVPLGCFMHSINHPKLQVACTVARTLLERLGLEVQIRHPEDYLVDFLGVHGPVWPVYPEIASRYGLEGHLYFKVASASPAQFIGLKDFISGSFQAYAQHPKEEFTTPLMSFERFANLFDQALASTTSKTAAVVRSEASATVRAGYNGAPTNPYKGLPAHRFWRKAVELVEPSELDPVVQARFVIEKTNKVASAGSCFAQHISRQLKSKGFNYYIAEQPPPGLSPESAQARSFGVFSARYGNIYTARQLVQLFDRAYGDFEPADRCWRRSDGRYVDPFRPQIEPDGFRSVDELEESRSSHLSAVRRMFEQLDVFTFTLGLTEAWCSKSDGAVYPLAPGVAGGDMDYASYRFVNFTVEEVIVDLNRFLANLRDVNPRANVILTVSPVPLIATYEDRHVLQATTYSKAVLRVAAETIRNDNPNVDYFPSYEIITGQFNRGAYFEDDLRSVKQPGVEHVMRLFLKHFTDQTLASQDSERVNEMTAGFGILCDEQQIESSVA